MPLQITVQRQNLKSDFAKTFQQSWTFQKDPQDHNSTNRPAGKLEDKAVKMQNLWRKNHRQTGRIRWGQWGLIHMPCFFPLICRPFSLTRIDGQKLGPAGGMMEILSVSSNCSSPVPSDVDSKIGPIWIQHIRTQPPNGLTQAQYRLGLRLAIWLTNANHIWSCLQWMCAQPNKKTTKQ